METDIVERLRSEVPCAICELGSCYHDQLMTQAADEIERLRAVCGSMQVGLRSDLLGREDGGATSLPMDDPSRTSKFETKVGPFGTKMVRTVTYTAWRPA